MSKSTTTTSFQTVSIVINLVIRYFRICSWNHWQHRLISTELIRISGHSGRRLWRNLATLSYVCDGTEENQKTRGQRRFPDRFELRTSRLPYRNVKQVTAKCNVRWLELVPCSCSAFVNTDITLICAGIFCHSARVRQPSQLAHCWLQVGFVLYVVASLCE
jgi:hypothetical protein